MANVNCKALWTFFEKWKSDDMHGYKANVRQTNRRGPLLFFFHRALDGGDDFEM